jgi:hypothetical protein
LAFVGQAQEFHGCYQIVGQRRDGVEHPVGGEAFTRRMVQVQAAQHFLEQLFLPALQPVARPNRRRVGAPLVAGDEGITPEHFAVLLPAGRSQREGERISCTGEFLLFIPGKFRA